MQKRGDSSANGLGTFSSGAGVGPVLLPPHRRPYSGAGGDPEPLQQGFHTEKGPEGRAGRINLRRRPKRSPPRQVLSASPAHSPAATIAAPSPRLVPQRRGLPRQSSED